MCACIKIFSARGYIPLTAIVKFRIRSPKTAENVEIDVPIRKFRIGRT